MTPQQIYDRYQELVTMLYNITTESERLLEECKKHFNPETRTGDALVGGLGETIEAMLACVDSWNDCDGGAFAKAYEAAIRAEADGGPSPSITAGGTQPNDD